MRELDNEDIILIRLEREYRKKKITFEDRS